MTRRSKVSVSTVMSLLAGLTVYSLSPNADAFCGFYVSGADAKLFNNATQVAIMREGTKTILSMQNNYQGPPENFAMVVPVPVVLQKENVKTLPREIFDKLDQLTAPRLVEYWERDPCEVDREREESAKSMPNPAPPSAPASMADRNYGVKVEAKFTVGEYEIVILSATDASGLDRWLKDNRYKIPDGATPYLRPYVQSGSKFFVARVDVSQVKFEHGQAMLSPLRFHYDSDTFSLPVRLGLINSNGTQDLIVNVLAKSQRYEVANYPNVTIPTNLDVAEEAKDKFGTFYTSLFDRTMERNPKAVVTEYSWDASSCDPCPTPPLEGSELMTLGSDVLNVPSPDKGPPRTGPRPMPPPNFGWGGGFVVTRLHTRYQKDALGDDLIFRAAPPIQGGREVYKTYSPNGGTSSSGLEKGSLSGSMNNFQGRYAIRHPWKGEIKCDAPIRGRWGGPPSNMAVAGGRGPKAAAKIEMAPRTAINLGAFIREDVPELGLTALAPPAPLSGATSPPAQGAHDGSSPIATPPKSGGCAGCSSAPVSNGAPLGLAIAAIGLAVARIKRRS